MNFKSFSVLFVLVLATFGVFVVFNNALGQGHDHQHMTPNPAAPCCESAPAHSHDGQASMSHPGEPAHNGMEMGQMMTQMAKNPEMVRHHLTMMIENTEMRPVLVSLLKEDAGLRQAFEKVLSDARK